MSNGLRATPGGYIAVLRAVDTDADQEQSRGIQEPVRQLQHRGRLGALCDFGASFCGFRVGPAPSRCWLLSAFIGGYPRSSAFFAWYGQIPVDETYK
jgi:hypothetical protein